MAINKIVSLGGKQIGRKSIEVLKSIRNRYDVREAVNYLEGICSFTIQCK